uniref:Odorant receptor n=1 Tax=Histia rhodope TaxID=1453155 RepID=A0A7G4KBT9_9NEOP|nr:odorant receptor [Histia rhodope]
MLHDRRPLNYFGLHFWLLRFLGIGWWHDPFSEDKRNFPSWYLYYSILMQIVWVAGFVGLETIDPFVGDRDLTQFMFSLAFVVTHDLTIFKLFIFYIKNKDIKDVVRTLEVDLYDYYQQDEKIFATIKKTKILTGAFLFFGWIIIGNTNVHGAIVDIQWKAEVAMLNNSSTKPPRTLPLPIFIPWSYQNDTSYIFTFIFETIGLFWTGHIVMTIDSFIGTLILHMSNQFIMLQDAYRSAYDRTVNRMLQKHNFNDNIDAEIEINKHFLEADKKELIVRKIYTAEHFNSELEKTLKSCYKQHQILIECVQKFATTYSYGFMIQLLSSVTAICALMVQISHDASSLTSSRLVTSLAFFVVMIIQLAIQCFTGNELTYQAGLVSEAVMECKWEHMPVRLGRMLVLCCARAQRPLRLTAAGFTHINIDCFLSIMKAAYSYYAVLSQKQYSN